MIFVNKQFFKKKLWDKNNFDNIFYFFKSGVKILLKGAFNICSKNTH